MFRSARAKPALGDPRGELRLSPWGTHRFDQRRLSVSLHPSGVYDCGMGHGLGRDELRAWIALQGLPGIGPAQFFFLIGHFGSALEALAAPCDAAAVLKVKDAETIGRLRRPDWKIAEQALRWAETSPHAIVPHGTPEYPPLLAEISRPPPLLFVDGSVAALQAPQLAMVGSRNATLSGVRRAQELSGGLARLGFVITSGMAMGIDAAAHQGALGVGGLTLAVLGGGTECIYPRRHARLADRIRNAGALISEFAPTTPPSPVHFPRRNRIISGLSLGTIVVQAQERSGSLITARHALEQGREVFALPGAVDDPFARGCNRLIQTGAKLVCEVGDVVAELGQFFVPQAQENASAQDAGEGATQLDPDVAALFRFIEAAPVSASELIESSGLTPNCVSSILLKMELDGLIESRPGGLYVRSKARPAV
jgi:DNA processing protein